MDYETIFSIISWLMFFANVWTFASNQRQWRMLTLWGLPITIMVIGLGVVFFISGYALYLIPVWLLGYFDFQVMALMGAISGKLIGQYRRGERRLSSVCALLLSGFAIVWLLGVAIIYLQSGIFGETGYLGVVVGPILIFVGLLFALRKIK
jgi:hypothetical protein